MNRSHPFYQAGPNLTNQFDADRVLRSILKRKLPPKVHATVEQDLRRFGERVVTDLLELSIAAERNKPRLIQFDPWGHRIDCIETSQAWKDLDAVSAQEGIVATGYEREFGSLSRLVQFAKLYLYQPSSALYTCPLAMTDGAAKLIEVHGDDELKKGAFKHLTSRDPKTFWTSGQWMTERTGGSDVGGTQTEARLEGGEYRLYGDKWFTSATTSQMAMTLARLPGAPEGSRGLSLFYLELRTPDGNLKNIRVNRLKDKLGTDALPTAELTLDGTPAKLIGGEGGGVRKIATLFNVTRLYNACCAVGNIRRGVALARDYAPRRIAFGKPLSEHPLHLETLAWMQVQHEAALHLVMHAAELLGKEELGEATTQESAVLRGLMPLAKLYTGKQGVSVISEVVESFGGAGYIEDTGIPRILRDTQVLAIWEGTTNVLSLDLLRAIEKEGAFEALIASTEARLAGITDAELSASVTRVREAVSRVKSFMPQAVKSGPEGMQMAARIFAFSMARVFAAGLLLEHAQWSFQAEKDRRSSHAAIRWCSFDLAEGLEIGSLLSQAHLKESRSLALDQT
jgi:alkylation response protein AidB-like acyl-CoA dehydrogenase